MPSLVTISGTGSVNNGTVTYRYLSDGTKLSAICSNGTGRLYRGSFVYGRQTAGASWREESIAWDGGRILCGASAGADADGNGNGEMGCPLQNYTDALYATDHLGNTRAVIDISPDTMNGYGSLTPSDILLEQDDYLPFGLRAGTSSATASGFDNLWRYAGKEEQRFGAASGSATASVVDLGLLDFGARTYDPVIARWTTPDPLASKFPSMSPYNYCGNDPVNRIDPDGREPRIYIQKENIGHCFVTVNDGKSTMVYSYGRYGALTPSSSGITLGRINPTGEGVMIRKEGKEAVSFLTDVLKEGNFEIFSFPNASDDNTAKFYNEQIENGHRPSAKGKKSYNDADARVIDTYKLLSNNCATTSIAGINANGANTKSSSAIPAILSLQLSIESKQSGNVKKEENPILFIQTLINSLCDEK